jgi:hypothetical protein
LLASLGNCEVRKRFLTSVYYCDRLNKKKLLSSEVFFFFFFWFGGYRREKKKNFEEVVVVVVVVVEDLFWFGVIPRWIWSERSRREAPLRPPLRDR